MELSINSKADGVSVAIWKESTMRATLTLHLWVGPPSEQPCCCLHLMVGRLDKLTSLWPFAKVHRSDLSTWNYPSTTVLRVLTTRMLF